MWYLSDRHIALGQCRTTSVAEGQPNTPTRSIRQMRIADLLEPQSLYGGRQSTSSGCDVSVLGCGSDRIW